MENKTIRLYTRQNDKTLFMLEQSGRLLNQRIYVQMHFGDMAQHYLDCYDWFAREAARRVPKPADVELPIWCAIRPGDCLLPVEGTVIYIVDVPENQVIFFDDAKWDYVLNHRYLPVDDADELAYRKHLDDIGVASSFEFFEGRYAGKYPEEMQHIRESWHRVFEVPDRAVRTICGNIWEIRREQIRRVVRPGETVFSE